MKKITKKNSIIMAIFILAIIIINLIISQFIDYWLSSLLVSFVTAVSLSVIGYGIYLCLTTLIDWSDFREKLFNGIIIFTIVAIGAGIYDWFINNNMATKTAAVALPILQLIFYVLSDYRFWIVLVVLILFSKLSRIEKAIREKNNRD